MQTPEQRCVMMNTRMVFFVNDVNCSREFPAHMAERYIEKLTEWQTTLHTWGPADRVLL